MNEEIKPCTFMSSAVAEASTMIVEPNMTGLYRMIHKLPFIKKGVWNPTDRIYPEVHIEGALPESLNLQPGELVEVRSEEEIFSTLDKKGKNKGLYFLPEMRKDSGKKFRVFKRVSRIKLEETGEMRKMKTPAIFLESNYCTGEFHENCERSCFNYWREIWLKRI